MEIIMKKSIALLLSLVIALSVFLVGCGKADTVIDLGANPVNTEFEVADIDVKENFEIDFIVPEAGFIKLQVTDATEYEIWPDNYPEMYATFVDENGKELYPKTAVDCSYNEKYRFEAGKVTAKIEIKNYTEETKNVSVCWAFAPDTDDIPALSLDSKNPAVARVNESGQSKFSFHADYDAVYSFFCAEACVPESDCVFYIENDKGEKVTGDLVIHATEWASRNAFLTAGNYTITVFGDYLKAVASCKAQMKEKFDDVVLKQDGELNVPVNLGFNAVNFEEKTVKFTSDGSQKYLSVNSTGAGDYYEYEQEYTLKITDSSGKVLFYDTDTTYLNGDDDFSVSGDHRFDLTGITGEITVSVKTADSCVVSVNVE